VGVGLKAEHYGEVLEGSPRIDFVEVHAENYLLEGGPRPGVLERIARDMPVSIHGVSASLGGAEPLDAAHLERLRALVARVRPALVSEHVAWCRRGGRYHADLLPIPYTEESLGLLAAHVDQLQEVLGRRILVENPATYLEFSVSDLAEPEFLAELVRRTGCGLLVDVNNLYVSASNHGWDIEAYLDRIPSPAIGEYHLAGHTVEQHGGARLRIDTHDAPVCDAVWVLFETVIRRFGPRPLLLERDDRLPAFAVLEDEALRAGAIMQAVLEEQEQDADADAA